MKEEDNGGASQSWTEKATKNCTQVQTTWSMPMQRAEVAFCLGTCAVEGGLLILHKQEFETLHNKPNAHSLSNDFWQEEVKSKRAINKETWRK